MATLKKAHDELYKRDPDEIFQSFADLQAHCDRQRQQSQDLWKQPDDFALLPDLTLRTTNDEEDPQALSLNDWSFSQLCRMANVSKETINRLTPATASQAFRETLPRMGKPLQILRTDETARSVHGAAYTRLWNAELLDVVNEFASDFTPPQKAMNDVSTGLYCGEQDMFAFMIDPQGWIEINNQPFAPGFFVWNSEVGKRSVGIQTFWFQKICANHLVWDATEVVEFSRKHTANVRDGLDEIRCILERLIMRRDSRRDSFATRHQEGDDRATGQLRGSDQAAHRTQTSATSDQGCDGVGPRTGWLHHLCDRRCVDQTEPKGQLRGRPCRTRCQDRPTPGLATVRGLTAGDVRQRSLSFNFGE